MNARPRPVGLLLPGQGAQYARMAAGLYPHEPVFAAAMDEVFAAMQDAGPALRADWLAERPVLPVEAAAWAQPLLFAVDYAFGRMVRSWGIGPVALLGHSIGEMAAAVLTGVFTLPDAVRLVQDRVARVVQAPPGGMLAVAAAPEDVVAFLGGGVVVGAVNAPRQVVLTGPAGPLAATAARLAAEGLAARPVPSLSAFHSPLIEPVLAGAERVAAAMPRRVPDATLYSGCTGAPLRGARALDAVFWARQPAEPVRFREALDALLSEDGLLLLEAGPGQGLASLARRHPAVRAGRSAVLGLSPARPGPEEADRDAVRRAREALSAEGYELNP
ncbi:acyltransferase domain-containing protein [Streptomyces roseoverticillatus]|uniref:Acyltransferase domain-containing protein n=1 Tax=Streptomyces roseoverticillatus TaxID=66429 RepID=A0ABV3INX6_9ACTN